jgi:hypothetical protein
MPAGRPSLYREAYCQDMINHCVDGSSITSFAAEIGVSRECITEWGRVHPEFSLAVKKAKAKAAAWWEKAGRKVATEGGGNATLCVFGMKNMGGDDWSDTFKNEHTGKDGEPLPATALINLTAAQLEAIASIGNEGE